MNKNTQHIVALSCLIIAGSVVYYLFRYIPEQNKQTLQMSLQKQCLEIGSKRVKEAETYSKQNSPEITILGDFLFDKKTNNCFYRSTSIGQGIIQKNIVDLFTNKTLGHYMENVDGSIVSGDKGQFNYFQNTHFGIE